MSGLQEIKISTRLIGLGVLVVVFMVGLAALGMHTATTIYDTQETVISITEIVSDVQDIVHDWKNILVRGGDPVEFEKYQADINTHIQIADKRFDEIGVNYKRHGGDLGQFYQAESSFQSMINKYQESVRFYEKSNNMRNVLKVDAMVNGADKATLDSLKKIANDFNTKTDADMSAEIVQMIVISAIGIVSTCLLLFLVIRHITSGLNTLSHVVDKVAEGDLRTKIMDLGKNELGLLAKGFSRMAENLTKSMRQNQATSNEMFSTIEQLTQATHKQAASSSQQAASVNQTTSAVEQIKATFAQTLEKVQQLGEKAEHVHSEGQRGTESLDQLVGGMKDIQQKVEQIAQSILGLSEQTQQIGEITRSVNALAQQSKLLSLNASIEAAKAGEAGKGFAVVATEVKDLAEKSQQATQQVQKLLGDIQQATEKAVMNTEEGSKVVVTGLELTQQTSAVFNSLNQVIEGTTTASQQIVAAVRQEASGIDQIASAMTEINSAIQEFASTTEQTKQVTHGLETNAKKMMDMIKMYKLDDGKK